LSRGIRTREQIRPLSTGPSDSVAAADVAAETCAASAAAVAELAYSVAAADVAAETSATAVAELASGEEGWPRSTL
jgi:hypothetical protein